MRLLISFLLLSVGLLQANEALDVLEGKKMAADIELPLAPEDSIVNRVNKRDSVVYIQPQWKPSPLDPVWAKATLFDDPTNPWVQQLAITGFFDFHATYGKAEVKNGGGNVDLDGSRTRRARLGARLRMFRNTDIEAVSEFAGSSDYRGIDRLSAQTTVAPGVTVKVGKFRPQFAREYGDENVASPYPNRTMLANMISPRSCLGIMYSKNTGDWEYGLGWFSSDNHPDLPGIEGDGFLNLQLARTMVEPGGISNRRLRWHLNYIHNFDANKSSAIPRYDLAGRFSSNGGQAVLRNPAYRHLVATGLSVEQDRFALSSDVMLGMGEDRVWGLTLGPSYWLIPNRLKLVGRYHYAESREPGGLVSAMGIGNDPLYDPSPFFVGDEYESIYIGANLHLYQDQMVLMGGLEQIDLSDDAGAGFGTEASIWHLGAKLSF